MSYGKNKIKLRKTFTDLDAKKQGLAICLSLTGKARETALELSVENVNIDTGVVQLLAKLDELYLKDKDQLSYAAYDSSDNFKRPRDMSIKNYLITFERLHHKILQYNIKLPEPVLAYRVLGQNPPPRQKPPRHKPPDKNPPDINPWTKTPWTKTPLAKNPLDKNPRDKTFFSETL